MQPKRSERGESLISMLVMVAILAILASIAAPSAIKLQRVVNQNAAAVQLSQILAAETAASQLWGGYFAPPNLIGSLAAGAVSCSNPNLITGQTSQSPADYVMQFHGSGTGAPCVSVPTYTGYTINYDPTFLAQRHFYVSSADGIIRFNDSQTAGPTDNPYPVAAPPTTSQTSLIVIPSTPTTGNTTPVAPGGGYNVTATFTAPFGSYPQITGWVAVSPTSGQIIGSGLTSGTFSGTLGQSGNSAVYVSSWGQTFSGMANFSGPNFTFVGSFTTDQKYTLTVIGVPQ